MRRILCKITVLILLVFVLSSFIKAQDFEPKVFIDGKDTLPYNLLYPLEYLSFSNDSPEKQIDERKFPLILFLHGAGERGTDNKQQIIHIKSLFLDSTNRANYQSFVLAPQCPEKSRWVEVDWSAQSHQMPEEPSWALQKTLALIEKIKQTYPIDTCRIYITGLSMGGYGTWDLILRFPEKFAAAIPICGGGNENLANRLVNLPIWAFHGSNDKVVPVIRSRNMVTAIRKQGGKIRYTEYKGVGHGSWIKAYKEKDLLKWLFEQNTEY